jgi:hypothetical protein
LVKSPFLLTKMAILERSVNSRVSNSISVGINRIE